MTPLTSGPELDARIAKLCGLRWCDIGSDGDCILVSAREMELRLGKSYPELGDGVSFSWCPSDDVHAAFQAAELVGLFDSHAIGLFGDSWKVFNRIDLEKSPQCPAMPTPAMAICAAILAIT